MRERSNKIRYVALDVDQFNMQALRALHAKLHRDYLGFFGSLYELYGKSNRRKEIVQIIGQIKRAISILDRVLTLGNIRKEDVDTLLLGIDDINKSKEKFIEDTKNVSELGKRVEKVIEQTGVSTQDLNISRQAVKRGASLALKSQKRRSTTERAISRTHEYGKKILAGAKVAAFGPFTPIADIIGDITKDIIGRSRVRQSERKEREFERQLYPASYGPPPTRAGQVMSKKSPTIPTEDFGGVSLRPPVKYARGSPISREEQVAPLVYFFNNKAYKAKWTKELLERFKGIKDDKRGVGLMGALSSVFGKMSGTIGSAVGGAMGGMAGLLGKYLPYLALISGAVVAGRKVVQAGKAAVELEKSRSGLRGAGERLKESQSQLMGEVEKQGLEPIAKRLGKVSPRAYALEIASRRQKSQLAEIQSRPWYERGPLGKVLGYKKPEITPFYKSVEDIEKKGRWSEAEKRTTGPVKIDTTEMNRIMSGTNNSINDLSKSIKEMSESMRKEKEVPNIRGAGVGNIFDSADPLINSHAAGRLSLGD